MARIFSKLRQQILSLFFLNEDKQFYVRQVAYKLGCSPMGAQKELKRLEDEGILQFEHLGRLKLYSLNKKNPAYSDLRGLIIKSFGLVSLLSQKLKAIEGIKEAFIYGSFAKDEADSSSDIDLFVIGDVDYKKLNLLISQFESQFGRELNIEYMKPQEVEARLQEKDAYTNDVLSGRKIPVI